MKKTIKFPKMSMDMMDMEMDMTSPKETKKYRRPYMKSGKHTGESYERKFSAKKPKAPRSF